MKHLLTIAFALIALLTTSTALADTAFTYQGRLDSSGQPYSGMVDMDFLLYDTPTGGSALANDLGRSVQVTEGLFQVELDFDMLLDQASLYLEISVDGQILDPRQAIHPAPLAAFALNGNEGPQGPQGEAGPVGPMGPPGESCTVSACSPEGQAALACPNTPPMNIGCTCTAPPEIEVRLVDPPPSEIRGTAPFRLDASASTVSFCGFEVPTVHASGGFENCDSPGQACILYEWSCEGETANQSTVCNASTDGWDQAAYSADYSYAVIDWYPQTYVRYKVTLAIYEVGFDGTFSRNSEKSWIFDTVDGGPAQ